MSKRKDDLDGNFFTKIKNTRLTYHWNIGDFDQMMATKSVIKSESFLIKNIPDLRWYFSLTQFTDDKVGTSLAGAKRYISVYLNCVGSNEALIKLILKFTMINADNSHGYNSSLIDNSPTESQSYGFEKYISHDSLMNIRNLYKSSNDIDFSVEIDVSTYVNSLKKPVYSCQSGDQCLDCGPIIETLNFDILFENSDFSDLTLICQDERIPVHRAVLAARSKSFYDKFKSLQSNELQIQIDLPILRELLSFMYTGNCPNLQNYVEELLEAATYCKMPDLRCFIEQTLIGSINLENAADRLVRAEDHDLKNLKHCAMVFIKLNVQEIIKTDGFQSIIDLHPKLVKELFCSVVEHFHTIKVDTRQER
ncbi:speckle-type POZ protein-like [Belonocnema kinseyi]|uniref:speckle-type POZ protein-like n=1 Tax=Belonocnema kinseyi TaxID=2817044 RepID=UPI00143E0ACB|nr:speckle-type POZ protein-like [Belonocnema kinseyi]